MTPLNTIIEEEKKEFDGRMTSSDRYGGFYHGIKSGVELYNFDNVKDFLTTAMQRAHEAGELDVLERERAYWVNVFDSAPVREKEHPNDVVARNFARIEIERLDTLLSKIRS